MPLHLLRQEFALRVVAVLEHFLDDIVAKDVAHQLSCMWQHFVEERLLFFRRGRIELLLDKTAAVLIRAEFDYAAEDVGELEFAVLGVTTAELFEQWLREWEVAPLLLPGPEVLALPPGPAGWKG